MICCLFFFWHQIIGIVHGDIRGFNLIFGEEEASIIDWDFAGKAGESRYGKGFLHTLPDTSRHPDACEGNVMEKKHDWFSLGAVMRLMKPGRADDNDAWQNTITAVEMGEVEHLQLSEDMSLSLRDAVLWVGFDGEAWSVDHRRGTDLSVTVSSYRQTANLWLFLVT